MQIDDRIRELGGDILDSERFKIAETVPHHGTTSVARHSMDVARYALTQCLMEKAQGREVNEEDVVRAALLHDIGMTDRGIFRSNPAKKAYSHPLRSAEIAKREFNANRVQIDAILRHMWPIAVTPPKYEEGWILISADKFCSVKEVSGVPVDRIHFSRKGIELL